MLLALLVVAAAPNPLVGSWQMNGEPFLTLNANGTGSMEGDPLKWKSDGSTLTLTDPDGEADRLPYQVNGDVLVVNLGGMPVQLTRAGGKKNKPAAETVAPPVAPKATPAGNDQLSRLLLSSNWCWLRYSNGNSYTQKVHFNANGTWQDFSESDIYSNNAYTGTVAQATGNRTNGGQWAVKGGQLYLSSPENPVLSPVPLTITRNSNGYPIINADGREYSMCN
ncbi:MAG: hypothetical protein U0228_07155 [Myxococcaceae bacterium]